MSTTKTIITLIALALALGVAIWAIRATGHGCTSCYVQTATTTASK